MGTENGNALENNLVTYIGKPCYLLWYIIVPNTEIKMSWEDNGCKSYWTTLWALRDPNAALTSLWGAPSHLLPQLFWPHVEIITICFSSHSAAWLCSFQLEALCC